MVIITYVLSLFPSGCKRKEKNILANKLSIMLTVNAVIWKHLTRHNINDIFDRLWFGVEAYVNLNCLHFFKILLLNINAWFTQFNKSQTRIIMKHTICIQIYMICKIRIIINECFEWGGIKNAPFFCVNFGN